MTKSFILQNKIIIKKKEKTSELLPPKGEGLLAKNMLK